ncbi:uncharacterized protein (DUF58 family) [Desmospora activa DSM 45169]|uniref:Uncharacterized protein (DUF58 family) n=1 Tax=Desmospora activa DSM 45169 TaxID=1121389 RepID=A0A2T4Z0E0_9BACL|nr:uncharacterized protein (DUF58 family) [Desmospora activa DSM 45169]
MLILLTASAYAFARFQGGHVPWFLFYVLLVMLVYAALVRLFSLSGIEIIRHFSTDRITQGERLRIQVFYRLQRPFPLSWLLVRHHGGGTVYLDQDRHVDFPGWKRQGLFESYSVRLPRGRHHFGEVEVSSGDLFGFVEKRITLPETKEVLVYPRIRPIRSWSTVNERNTGQSLSTLHIAEDVAAVVGVRDYSNRDRLSRIHWKASARGRGLKVKEFEQRITNDFLFVLDCWKGDGQTTASVSFERAVSLTASLIHHALERRFSAGLLTTGQLPGQFPLGRGQEHLLRLCEHLAEVKKDGDRPLKEPIAQQTPYLSRGMTVVVITTQLEEELQQAIMYLSHVGIRVECCWVSNGEPPTAVETACYAQLRRWGVRCVSVTHDDFDQIFRGGDFHGMDAATGK